MKYHYLYRTTNILTGEYYIGVHSTNNIDDGYLGSGSKLLPSVKAYGKASFVKEVIETFNNRADAVKREKEIVSKSVVKEPLCLNAQVGGGKVDIRGWIQKKLDYQNERALS